MDSKAVVMLMFRVKGGISLDNFLMEVMRIESVMKERPGFLSHELLRDPQGMWVDILHWESIEAAQAASRELMSASFIKSLAGYVDLGSVRFYNLQQLMDSRI